MERTIGVINSGRNTKWNTKQKRDDVRSNLKHILDYLIKIRKEVQEAQKSLHKSDGPYGAGVLSKADNMSAEETEAILDNLGDVLDEITPQVENAKEMIDEIEETIQEQIIPKKECKRSPEYLDFAKLLAKLPKEKDYQTKEKYYQTKEKYQKYNKI